VIAFLGSLKILSPRRGHFDSWLLEAGPPAISTGRGIVLLYNAGNSADSGDARLPAKVYTGGQALFDLNDPTKLVARGDEPFIKPTEDYERTGQYPEGTTFVEGLVPFKGRWFLYIWDGGFAGGGGGLHSLTPPHFGSSLDLHPLSPSLRGRGYEGRQRGSRGDDQGEGANVADNTHPEHLWCLFGPGPGGSGWGRLLDAIGKRNARLAPGCERSNTTSE